MHEEIDRRDRLQQVVDVASCQSLSESDSLASKRAEKTKASARPCHVMPGHVDSSRYGLRAN